MPSLIDLRRRIRAVKNTQQITKAMKTVSASKLRRAQERIMGARPFAREMSRVLSSLATRVDPSSHPLLGPPPADTADVPRLLFVVTADKGLCGGFNSALLRRALAYVRDSDRPVALGLVGRKGRDFFRRHQIEVRYEDVNIFSDLRYTHGEAVAQVAIEQYVSGRAVSVHLLYNEFKSVIQQDVVVDQLLPIRSLDRSEETEALADYLFEPAPRRILDTLLPHHVETQVFRALLESAAAEHAARMTAMDTATRNAGEMIDALTLHMNKVRQATITRELIEVVSGAQAL